jgi:hypothetical protein
MHLIIIKRLLATSLLMLATVIVVFGQSTNVEFPTPVTATEVSGEILARDIGDARLTRHFYLLTGMPGDLVLTVESNNLNGDVDLFTAGSFRPLTKLTIYAGLSTTSTTKSVYLRRREPLILRVEARSANDDTGRYRIRFSGGFEPLAEAQPAPENDEPPTTQTPPRRSKNTRRVNAAGARIAEEPEPVAEVKTPEPEPKIEAATETPNPNTTATTEEPAPVKPKPTTPRTGRTRRPARATRRPPATSAKKTEAEATPAQPATPTPAPVGPRLIIETTDGMRVERYMSEVRRMTVERGQLIVITNDGKVERRSMSNVLRVTIEP